MRILYHHRTLGDGAEGVHIREMVSAFQELGHEVRMVALVGEQNQSWTNTKSRWAIAKRLIPEWSLELAEISYNAIGQRSVARAIQQFRPDFVYDRYNLYTTAAIKAARRAGIPSVLEVNSPIALERSLYEVHPLRFPRLANHYERYVFQNADHIFTVSTPLQEYLIKETAVPAHRVTVLPNGANPRYFDPTHDASGIRQKYNIGKKTVIGYVGSLRPWQGLDLLIESFDTILTKCDGLHLLIVGSGSMESTLQQQAHKLAIEDDITFCGPVDHHQMRSYLSAMDIGVSPSATHYASPMKILEYMAMGLPAVAPRMPNIADIVDDGENALLFEPENSQSLACGLERLIHDAPLATKLGAAARLKIENRLNWKYNASRVVEQALKLQRSV